MGFMLALIQSRVTISSSISVDPVRVLSLLLRLLLDTLPTDSLHLSHSQPFLGVSLHPVEIVLSVHRKEVLHTTERAVPALSHPQSEFLPPLPVASFGVPGTLDIQGGATGKINPP